MYIQLQMIINLQFVVLHTCTHTLFHTPHSREMQEIFIRTHNNKRPHFIEPFLTRSMRCKGEHFWQSFLSSPLILSHLKKSCRFFFFVWQWQQVCNQISNLRMHYWFWHPTSQQDNILSSLCSQNYAGLNGPPPVFPLFCFQLSAVMQFWCQP